MAVKRFVAAASIVAVAIAIAIGYVAMQTTARMRFELGDERAYSLLNALGVGGRIPIWITVVVMTAVLALLGLAVAWGVRRLGGERARVAAPVAGVVTIAHPAVAFALFTLAAPDLDWSALAWGVALIAIVACVRFGPRAASVAAAVIGASALVLAVPAQLRAMRHYREGAVALAGHIALGRYVRERLPDAHVLTPHAAAFAYYAETHVIAEPDDITHGGPGVRFEHLETLRDPPTHVAFERGTALPFIGQLVTSRQRVQLTEASFDHVHSGERPLNDHSGWSVVDRIDVADIASERAHRWQAATSPGSLLERATASGLALDGGRIIVGGERFTIKVNPNKPTRLVLRTAGTAPVEVSLHNPKRKLGTLTVASRSFSEVAFNLPPVPSSQTGLLELHTVAAGSYRAFHWFALQPE